MPIMQKPMSNNLPSAFLPVSGIIRILPQKICYWKIDEVGVLPLLPTSQFAPKSPQARCRIIVGDKNNFNSYINQLLTIRLPLQRLIDDFLKYHRQTFDPDMICFHWFLLQPNVVTFDQILLYNSSFTNIVSTKMRYLYMIENMRIRMAFNPIHKNPYKKRIKRLVWDPSNEREVQEAYNFFLDKISNGEKVYADSNKKSGKWIIKIDFDPMQSEMLYTENIPNNDTEDIPELPGPDPSWDSIEAGFIFPKL